MNQKLGNAKAGVILGIAATLLACASANYRILPGEDGIHRSVSRNSEQEEAQEDALEGAQEYCEKRKKDYVVVSDDAKYDGEMDENTRKTVKKTSQAAWMLGKMGGVVKNAGAAGMHMTDGKDYEAVVRFRCR